jgi:phosphoheptose isomerase
MDYVFSDDNQDVISTLGTEAYTLLATSIAADDGCKMVGFTGGAAAAN